MRKWITLAFIIWTAIPITAPALALKEIYQYQNAQGNLSFTNIPSQIPKTLQKDALIVHPKHLPPLLLFPETIQAIKKNPTLEAPNPEKAFPVSIWFLLLSALMFIGITMMGIKGRGKKIILRFLIVASLSAALLFFFIIEENPLSSKTTEMLKNNSFFFSPIKKAKLEVEEIEKQLKEKKAFLETIQE